VLNLLILFTSPPTPLLRTCSLYTSLKGVVHPALVVDTAGYFPLGFADIHIWNRSRDKKSKEERNYKMQPIA